MPSFFPHFQSFVDVTFLNALEYRLQFSLDIGHYLKTLSLHFHSQFGKKKKGKAIPVPGHGGP
jgi:hypothetical protein